MEQEKYKEIICKAEERFLQRNINRESDDKQNSIISQEMIDTD